MTTHASVQSRQDGVVAIIFAMSLLLIVGLLALSVDMARLYNRKVDLQTVADMAALAAAQRLVGSSEGVDRALTAAAEAATAQQINYGRTVVAWSNSAIQFSNSPTSGWRDAGAARLAPERMLFVRVDTSQLASSVNTIETTFLQVLSTNKTTALTSAVAVAGRPTLNVTPLAICAMSPLPASARLGTGELEEYGFRRGVGYDLMKLNSVPGETDYASFTISPMGGTGGSSSDTSVATVGPFVCSGSMPGMGLINETVSVTRPFKLGELANHLNSRFGTYPEGSCDYRAAPPDINVKEFKFGTAAAWMTATPTVQTAKAQQVLGRHSTIAELDDPGTDPALLGPLWAFARPVPFSAWSPGGHEPPAGYPHFPVSRWPDLYGQARPQAKDYGAKTPYKSLKVGLYAPPPSAVAPGVEDRRVLNVPLLACPVGGSTATVLAIGRFFMSVPATATSLSAEFGGLASERNLRGPVELYK